jgi:uncharacterized YigZ family protein
LELERFCVPTGQSQAEIVVKNSVFIGNVGRAEDSDAAHAFVGSVRAKYPDANHNAWAYRLSGGPQGLIGSSDDGEPGGTAGRPMLAVLEGTGLHQVVAVVTRYFGGTKLGTGGLVRAYSQAVREALQDLPTVELVLHRAVSLTVDYAMYGNLRYLLPKQGVRIAGERFAENVSLELAVPCAAVSDLAETVRDLSNGHVLLERHPEMDRYL